MKEVWAAGEVGRFLVTGATGAAGKPSPFYCRICRKDVSVLTQRTHGNLWRFQVTKHFPRDQRLRLETPGWQILIYDWNTKREEEVEHQRERFLRAPRVAGERESTHTGKTSLWTVLVQSTSASLYLRSRRRWSKHCNCPGAMSLSSSFGTKPLLSLGKLTWTWRGRAMRCWSLLYMFHDSSKSAGLFFAALLFFNHSIWFLILIQCFEQHFPFGEKS